MSVTSPRSDTEILTEVDNTQVVNEIVDLMTCVICRDVLYKPVTLLICQHSFCRTCLAGMFEKKCPTCRTPYIYPKEYNRTLDTISKLVNPERYAEVETEAELFQYSKDEKLRIQEELRNELFNQMATLDATQQETTQQRTSPLVTTTNNNNASPVLEVVTKLMRGFSLDVLIRNFMKLGVLYLFSNFLMLMFVNNSWTSLDGGWWDYLTAIWVVSQLGWSLVLAICYFVYRGIYKFMSSIGTGAITELTSEGVGTLLLSNLTGGNRGHNSSQQIDGLMNQLFRVANDVLQNVAQQQPQNPLNMAQQPHNLLNPPTANVPGIHPMMHNNQQARGGGGPLNPFDMFRGTALTTGELMNMMPLNLVGLQPNLTNNQ